MKVILINESQFSAIICEESGYAKVVKELVDYIYKEAIKLSYSDLGKGIGNFALNKIKLNQFKRERNRTIDINTETLNSLNINFIENIKIVLSTNNDSNGALLVNSIRVNPNTDKIQTATMEFNIFTILNYSIKNRAALYGLIQHEITHLYEYCQRYYSGKNDMEHLNSRRIASHHEDYEDYNNLQNILYYCDLLEMNATISQLYKILEKSKANKNNYIKIYQNTSCYSRLNSIYEFISILKTNLGMVEYIQNTVAPSYTRFKLPNSNGKSIQQYQPLLIKWFENRASNYQNRIRKVIGRYLYDSQK